MKMISYLWSTVLIFVGVWFFLLPCGISSYYVATDEGLHQPGGSKYAFAWHRKLSKRYANYAEERIDSGVAKSLEMWDIAGTEWPLFGSVFYLWSTMHLQQSWENNPELSKLAPAEYARDAIEAAKNLVLDEAHATWVKEYWGEDAYLNTENVFYRMLLMWAIIAHHELTGSSEDLEILREQVEALSAELDASRFGLLDDYPRQCYPTDVTAALAAISTADQILGTDRSVFLERSLRGFEGALAEPYGLPPYAANSKNGTPYDNSRGCGNSYFCSFAGMIWPREAEGWYRAYVDNFWQSNWFAVGFREFPKGEGKEWYFDVDAGPVLGGFGSAASAFGVAAARTNGDFRRGYSLSAEMLTYSWPLANGTLLLPAFVSDREHAPHLGEVAILYQLSSQPVNVAKDSRMASLGKGPIPGCVWILWAVQLLVGGLIVRCGWRRIKNTRF